MIIQLQKELEVVTSKPSAESEDDTAKSEQTVPSFSDKIYIETRVCPSKHFDKWLILFAFTGESKENPSNVPFVGDAGFNRNYATLP